MAISPGCVFYGRYAIHEYWLVFSLMLIAWGLMGLWKSGEKYYLWAVWIGITGTVLTKETYIIHFAAGLLMVPSVWLLGKVSRLPKGSKPAPQQWTWEDMGLGFAMFVGLVLFFYSGTLMDFPGLKGLYQCYADWVQTGKVGNGHEKPWPYWLKLVWQYEWPSCLGMAVALLTVLPRTPRYVRGLAIYGLGTFVAYSIVPYKTPWCIVSLTWPFLLLFGYGIDWLSKKYSAVVAVAGAVVIAANLCDMVMLNFYHYTDATEPYVYVQTFNDVNLLMKPLDQLVAQNPSNYQLDGSILMESYHPLPWLLGDFPNIGYYDQDDSNPPKMDADFLLVDESRIDDVESSLQNQYFTTMLRLRDAEDPAKLYLSVKKFQSVFPGRKPDFVPEKKDSSADQSASPSPTPQTETTPEAQTTPEPTTSP
jgi:hypothetical protein